MRFVSFWLHAPRYWPSLSFCSTWAVRTARSKSLSFVVRTTRSNNSTLRLYVLKAVGLQDRISLHLGYTCNKIEYYYLVQYAIVPLGLYGLHDRLTRSNIIMFLRSVLPQWYRLPSSRSRTTRIRMVVSDKTQKIQFACVLDFQAHHRSQLERCNQQLEEERIMISDHQFIAQ